MGHDPVSPSNQSTLDLSGLPDSVAEGIRKLVQTLRQSSPRPDATGVPFIGRFATPGVSIAKDGLDRTRRELWVTFPRDLPDRPPS
jgi:hypothetical protein